MGMLTAGNKLYPLVGLLGNCSCFGPKSQSSMALAFKSTCWLGSTLVHSPRVLRSLVPRASSSVQTITSDSQADIGIPSGCSRYSISVKKPLGLVLEQNKETGSITVVELHPEGNAAKTGLVSVGDQLIATSGITYSKEEDYNGAKVKMGQKVVRMTVLGQSFKTVSAAIGSHPGHMEVKLELQRCSPEAQ
eukprot:GHRR01011250.1.p1 GENE.GHRR01011250.1~~GHRR01011250.1.p1  ORF type:complete len:191 (+),score=35.41 GHRR01011250.1:62-634(+)